VSLQAATATLLKSKPLTQQADLRIVVKRSAEHGLVAWVRITNEDLYCGIRGESGEELFRTSYHESGQVHIYLFDGKKRDTPRSEVPLGLFRGCTRLWAIGVDLDHAHWRYRPSREAPTRRNFVIDLDTAPLPISIDIWIIERGRGELLVDIMREYTPPNPIKQLISSSLVDWTHPWVYAVAWGPSKMVTDSLEEFARKQGLPPGKIAGIVAGQGPPIGEVRTISRDDES
jgi:hypothetical protein